MTEFATQDWSEFRSWRAADTEDLRRIWRDLVAESDGEGTPRFRDREISPQQAGAVFEQWIVEYFRMSGADVAPPFSVPSFQQRGVKEQFDGVVYDGWQGFLIESKFWRKSEVGFGEIARLHLRVERRPNTLGLFFAPFGYSWACLEACDELRPVRVLLFLRADFEWLLDQPTPNLLELVRRKWRLAAKYGFAHWTDEMTGRATGSEP